MKGLIPLLLFLAVLMGCGGSGGGSAGSTGTIPPGFIKVSVTTTTRDANDVPHVTTRAERIVPRTVEDIMAAYGECLADTYPKLTRPYYGHELVVDQNLTSAGYSPQITISSQGMANPEWFDGRSRELLTSPGFLPASAQYTSVNFDTFSL